jgi:LmbE family N-acetylglucosaminyl deacetylase
MVILAFFAHPDDETMLAGGSLALLVEAGASVHYLCATRGEGGEVGEPPACEIENLGRVRTAEMSCAVQALGMSSLTFLDYIDPRVGPQEELFPYTTDAEALAGQVAAQARQVRADVLLTHGSNGEYGHPAHVVSHQAARHALELLGPAAPLLYTIAAAFPEHPRPFLANRDDPAHLVVDITPALERKTRAALCHHTQHALFTRRASQEAGRQLTVPDVIMTVESLHRAAPPLEGMHPQDDFADLLKPYLVHGIGEQG